MEHSHSCPATHPKSMAHGGPSQNKIPDLFDALNLKFSVTRNRDTMRAIDMFKPFAEGFDRSHEAKS
jgi:hypothetical protein